MTITGTDSMGTFIDTGVGTAPTPRPGVELEVHTSADVETGTTLTPATLSTKHVPHRPIGHPR